MGMQVLRLELPENSTLEVEEVVVRYIPKKGRTDSTDATVGSVAGGRGKGQDKTVLFSTRPRQKSTPN